MYRSATAELYKWREKKSRKPLIIRGARQVGKTWLMKDFGRNAFADAVYINFDNNRRMEELFSSERVGSQACRCTQSSLYVIWFGRTHRPAPYLTPAPEHIIV